MFLKCLDNIEYFIALEYIPGKHCDWKLNIELKEKLDFVIRDSWCGSSGFETRKCTLNYGN